MRERTGGASSINSTRSVYYMVKVLLAVFVGLFRARPDVRAGRARAGRGGARDLMDVSRLQILAIIVTAGLFVLVFELVRQRRLLERYALLWLFSSAVLLGALRLARRAGGAGLGGRHLLRAVGALRGGVRVRARAAAALLARHLPPR